MLSSSEVNITLTQNVPPADSSKGSVIVIGVSFLDCRLSTFDGDAIKVVSKPVVSDFADATKLASLSLIATAPVPKPNVIEANNARRSGSKYSVTVTLHDDSSLLCGCF